MADHYAVLGHPIAQSLSPQIHAMFAQQTEQDMKYTAIDVPPGRLDEFLASAMGQRLAGANVTMPHKEAAAEVSLLSPRARAAGAVNTLIRAEKGWRGDNTDGAGLLRDLARLGFPIAGQRLLIIGAGGATRGIIPSLLEDGPESVTLINRTMEKAEALAARFDGAVDTHASAAAYDGIIHASGAGHAGQAPKLENGWIESNTWCYDLSYGRAARPFLECTGSLGARRCADGLGMLIEQAAESFFLWRGVRPESGLVHDLLAATIDGSVAD